jgi:transcription initiation factor TFIIIB Brf1 subunit/transcription initiation factor TFIIB
MSILRRIPIEEVEAAAHAIWADKSVADKVAFDAVGIINQTYKRRFAFFNGKSAKYIVGGLFYLLSYRYDSIKKQNELADKLGTTDVTIRGSYRQWIETFPDLFLDVVGKFAADSNLRFYVLVNMKQKNIKT